MPLPAVQVLKLPALRSQLKKGRYLLYHQYLCQNQSDKQHDYHPVTEDAGMIAAARDKTLTIEKLEAMTAVCSVGLDMIVIPGDTPSETVSAIIADEAAIGMVNSKTTAVRVIPAIGRNAG